MSLDAFRVFDYQRYDGPKYVLQSGTLIDDPEVVSLIEHLNAQAAHWRSQAEVRRRRVNRLALLLAALGLWMALDGTIRLLSAFGLLG